MSESSPKIGKFIVLFVLAILALPAIGLFYTLVLKFDSQFEADKYMIAFEKDGKIYQLERTGSSSAFDKDTEKAEFYTYNTSLISSLIAMNYGEFSIDKSDNPFLSGELRTRNTKFQKTESTYQSATESTTTWIFLDDSEKEIYRYQRLTEDEFAVKLRPTFPYFSKRKYVYGEKQAFVNVSKLLKSKLGRTLKLRLDEPNKLLILSLQ